MGTTDSKLNFRKAVIQLTTKTQVLCASIQLNTGLYRETEPMSAPHHRGDEITFMMWWQKSLLSAAAYSLFNSHLFSIFMKMFISLM